MKKLLATAALLFGLYLPASHGAEPQADRHYSIGVDWGRKLDFTVLCVLDCTDPVARLVGLWRWQGTNWEVQVEMVAQIVVRPGIPPGTPTFTPGVHGSISLDW